MTKLLLVRGDAGNDVEALRQRLRETLGTDNEGFPSLQAEGTPISDDFIAAVRLWQSGVGLVADGIVGPRCQLLLGLRPPVALALKLSLADVGRLFPATKPANIARYLPYVEAALAATGLADRPAILAALATVRAETEGFVPISELPSKYNTRPGQPPFSTYDNRPEYGHDRPGDGERYRGRGFVQLTWKANYRRYGDLIGLDLVARPDDANAPEVAALLLCVFLADKVQRLRSALAEGDLKAARRLVNGGSHGLDRFTDVFNRAEALWPLVPLAGRTGAAKAAGAVRATSKVRKDSVDLRDRLYLPPALSLPDVCPSDDEVRRFLPAYTGAGLILDQGQEGACTGFGLACVVNYLRWQKGGHPGQLESVSPRMLYTLARRYDEYEGENYEGSSCRGAIKGWFHHGVCLAGDWPYEPQRTSPPRYGYARRAAQWSLGVYYRIELGSITDLQAAIAQHRAVFASAFTHDGWSALSDAAGPAPTGHADLPVIPFGGRPSQTDGHAFALVGYNAQGFVIQNSWGPAWGAGGFGVITYADWLANAMDAWVVALGVPGVLAGRLASTGVGAARAKSGADTSAWWDVAQAYRHSVVLGNDGRVSRYLTEDEAPRKLQHQAGVLPDQWFRRAGADGPRRLVIYAHGGLNSEADAIARARAMGRYFLGNGCYPLFLVWKTGLLESIGNALADHFRRDEARAGNWLSDQTDLLVEKTIGRLFARPLWSEMKENAQLAFEPRRGGPLLLDALQSLAAAWGDRFELHLVGHSAGSIALGHLLAALAQRQRSGDDEGLRRSLKSVHLYAPACSVAFAQAHYGRDEEVMQRLHVDLLSDRAERDDSVAGVYRKSLLYLVAHALEPDLRTPILGLERVADPDDAGWDGSSSTAEVLAAWRQAAQASGLAQRTRVLAGPHITVAQAADGRPVQQPIAHGSFDNDVDVVAATLRRILGLSAQAALPLPVNDLRGF